MPICKQDLLNSLPVRVGGFTIRARHRDDLDSMAEWPDYPAPFEPFNAPYDRMSADEKDQQLARQSADPGRVTLMVDHETQPCVIDLCLKEINWGSDRVGGIGVRTHPQWCGRGAGTLVIRAMAKWLFELGMVSIGLDVCAANVRAVRCYEKVGFAHAGEFWRDDAWLGSIDINQPPYDAIMPHARFGGPIPEVRFYLMELTPERLR